MGWFTLSHGSLSFMNETVGPGTKDKVVISTEAPLNGRSIMKGRLVMCARRENRYPKTQQLHLGLKIIAPGTSSESHYRSPQKNEKKRSFPGTPRAGSQQNLVPIALKVQN